MIISGGGGPKKSTPTCSDHQIYSHDDLEGSPPDPYTRSSIVEESKNKLVISIPAAAAAIDEEVMAAAERRKRRRLHQQPAAAEALLPLFFQLRPLAPSKSSGVEHDDAKKVPKVITSPSSPNTLHRHLAALPEVDLELRLALTK
jgi:hypothetical protein